MSRSRAFCFTINNPEGTDFQQVKDLSEEVKYMIVGKETGENGTLHLQGYIYFKEAKTWTSVKKKLPRAHLEIAKGNPLQNRMYCIKEQLYLEKGELPKRGERSDLERVVQDLREGANMRSVVESARSTQSVRVAEIWLKYHEEGRDWKPHVRWFHGPTGVGKTRAAREWLGDDVYTALDTIKWWEGYDAHDSVLIDDFRPDFAKFSQMLKLLDRYSYKVETKGGSRQFLAKKIAITSPYSPEVMYQTREDVAQLLRRIDDIIEMSRPESHDDD